MRWLQRSMKHELPWIRRIARRHPAATILIAALLTALSALAISRAQFDTDVTRLIPAHAGRTSLYIDILGKTGGMDKAYLIFTSDRLSDHLPAVDAVGKELVATGLVTRAEWKLSDEARRFLLDVFAKKAPLLLDDTDRRDFLLRLEPGGMERELRKTAERLSLAGSPPELALADPLNLFELFGRRLPSAMNRVDYRSGYFLSPDGRQAVMVATPAGSPRDIGFAKRFVEAAEGVISRHRAPGLTIELTGSHAITLYEATVMKRELIMNIVMAFASVIVVFLLFFRSVSGLLFVIVPTVLSMVVTTGTVLLFTGTLSEVSGGFSALIAGLGIDLGIILYVRYLIDLGSAGSRTESMDRSIAMVHRGITTGILTSAITFLPMLLSSFRGVRELGLLTGIALIVCWLLLLGLVPLILRPSGGRLLKVGLVEQLTAISHERYRQVFVLTGMLSLGLALFIPRIETIGDISRLGTRDNPARAGLERLRGSYLKDEGIIIRGHAAGLDAALAESLKIKQEFSPVSGRVTAAGDFLPPSVLQEQRLAELGRLDADRVCADFRRASERVGFDTERFKPFLDRLRLMLENREKLTLAELAPLHDALSRLLVQDRDGWSVFVIAPSGGIPDDLLDRSGYDATGPHLVRKELLSLLTRDTVLISLVGLLLVNIVLYLDFRNLFDTILCQVPVFVGILWTLGVMGIAGISLNFMNAFVFVMLFGIGTDYTVHLLHRYLKDRDIRGTFVQTGTAVFVSGLTTAAGIGSIGVTSYQGLASMGQVTAIGTLFCVLLSLTLVPAMMRFRMALRDGGGAAQ